MGSGRQARQAEKPGAWSSCPRCPLRRPVSPLPLSPTHSSELTAQDGAALEPIPAGGHKARQAVGRMGRGRTSCAGNVTACIASRIVKRGTAGRLGWALHAA